MNTTLRNSNTVDSADPQSELGFSVAIAGEFLVFGEPSFGGGFDAAGRLQAYSRSGRSADLTAEGLVSATDTTEQFGSAIDLVVRSDNVPAMLVGASRTKGEEQTDYRFGAAYYMTYDGTTWNEVGGPIRGDETSVTETGALFGQAVAMATDEPRIVVAAPSSSIDINNLDTGKVYTYTRTGGPWTLTGTILEGAPKSFFGTSVDMSPDGNSLIVGAPGDGTADGLVNYYEWNGSDWTPEFEITGFSSASIGFSLSFINADASRFMIGGPSFNTDEGVIEVYVMSSNPTSFTRLGDPIRRSMSGERIGRTVCGRDDRVAFGTDLGTIHLYQYDSNTDSWAEIASVAAGTDPITACAMTEDGTAVAVGIGGRGEVFELS